MHHKLNMKQYYSNMFYMYNHIIHIQINYSQNNLNYKDIYSMDVTYNYSKDKLNKYSNLYMLNIEQDILHKLLVNHHQNMNLRMNNIYYLHQIFYELKFNKSNNENYLYNFYKYDYIYYILYLNHHQSKNQDIYNFHYQKLFLLILNKDFNKNLNSHKLNKYNDMLYKAH